LADSVLTLRDPVDRTAVCLKIFSFDNNRSCPCSCSENYPTALAIVPNKREKKIKKILDSCQVELWR